MADVLNRARMTIASTGTGDVTFGSAVTNYQSFADAGAVDTGVYHYVIEDGSAWEIGTLVYTASGTTGARTVTESTNVDAALNLTSGAEIYSAVTKATIDDKEPANTYILKSDEHATLTAGFDSDIEVLGTITSGTVTPEVDADTKGNFKTLTNNGAFTLAPPSTSSSCTILIQVTNDAAAGAITTSGFTVVNGDAYETTSGNDYFFHIKKVGGFTSLTIEALQ